MINIIWGIKLKLKAMVKEVKWGLSLKKYSAKNIQEILSLLLHLLTIHSIVLFADVARFGHFIKGMIRKKIIFIPLIFMLILFGFYLSLINGKPHKKEFNERFFTDLYYHTAIEVKDQEQRLAGTLTQPQSLVDTPAIFLGKTPDFFWSLLKERYDPHLDFESNATSFYNALFENPRYYNGIDIAEPFIESKKLIVRMITEQSLLVTSNPTLTKQLINAFLRHYPLAEKGSNIERLKLAKTFFHQLKANSGADFKSWLLSEKPFFFADGKGYGFADGAEVFFGKEADELSMVQQLLLLGMYKHPFRLNQSPKEQQRAWKKIQKEAIDLVYASKIIKNQYQMVSLIKKKSLPKLPYLPDSLMEVVGQITAKNQEHFSTLPTRSNFVLQSTKRIIAEELDRLFKAYSISPKNRLVTEMKINFHLDDNFYFNHYLKERIESMALGHCWVSVVNEKGEFIRLFQKNNHYKTPPQIGNLGKIFTLLLFADRGDRYYSKYCNKKAEGSGIQEEGYRRCSSKVWVDSRRLFSSDRMLPIYDGFTKYKEQDSKGSHIYYIPIYMQKIEALYQNLSLISIENSEPRSDLGAGKLQMTPLEMQVALHKITQLIYNSNRLFYGAKLIEYLKYYQVEEGVVNHAQKLLSFDSPEQITPMFKAFFTKEKRITLQTLFKASIYKSYGSLQWLKNYKNVKFVFAQESHKNGIHWLVGVFIKKNRYYSFTINIQDRDLSTKQVKKDFRNILETTIESVNRPEKMKFEYMKRVFGD